MIEQPRALICVKTSRQKDRSYLIAKKIINEITPKDYQAFSVDFELAKNALTSSDRLLQWFCTQITLKLNLQNTLPESWQEAPPSNTKCSKYLEKYLLPEISNALVLVLYNVELILENQAIADNLFGELLRSWKQDFAKEDSWNKLRLVIVHSKDIKTNPPFDVAVVIDFP
jgi:AAA-like domain